MFDNIYRKNPEKSDVQRLLPYFPLIPQNKVQKKNAFRSPDQEQGTRIQLCGSGSGLRGSLKESAAS